MDDVIHLWETSTAEILVIALAGVVAAVDWVERVVEHGRGSKILEVAMSALTGDHVQLQRHRAETPEEITARRQRAEAALGRALPVSDEEKRRYREVGKPPPAQ